jgi:hypothetical protein
MVVMTLFKLFNKIWREDAVFQSGSSVWLFNWHFL